ncbi:MAG: DUF6221 family protein [Actinomycetota bacterium]|nr:DUF6221 family protein [Actinomycetota bacterium]
MESAMRHLARRFADHPDYRDEWRPERQDPPPQWRLGHKDPGAEPADGLWGHPRRGKRATRHNPTHFSQRPLS